MVSSPSEMVEIAAIFYLLGSQKKRKRKKPWLERQRLRHSNTMSLLESDDLTCFIDTDTFDKLLKMVRPLITKKDAIMSQSVTAEERLIATLLFLAAGRGYQELKNSMLICPQLLAKIIPETCSAIFKALKHYLKMPTTKEEWKAIAKSFEQKWQFNNCIGCLDARHILIKKPSEPNSEEFINHEGTHSVICVVAANANHEFIYVHSGFTGNFSSTLLPQYTQLVQNILDDELELPESYQLPGTDKTVPYVFIGDGFWHLDTNVMTPYLGEEITESEKMFNYRLRRANTAENAFGILKSQFRVFDEAINLEYQAVNSLMLAACALHNFLINKPCYLIPEMMDSEDTINGTFIEGDWRGMTDPLIPVARVKRQPWNNGQKVRNDLTEYFCTTGRLPFQDRMVNVVPCTEPIPINEEVWKSIDDAEIK